MKESDLNKSLYQAVMKALGSKEGKQHAVAHAVADLSDNNMKAQMPESHIPASGSATLHKDVSVSEIHQQKQAQAEAKVGMRPGQSGPGMKKMSAATMIASEEKAERGIDKLRKFMEKCEMKKSQKGPAARARAARELKGVHTSGGFSGLEEEGRSQAGNEITSRAPKAGNKYLKEMHHARGVDMHREKLQELKDMPKPNLPKSEDGMKAK